MTTIVVGAGIFGASVAYSLALSGENVCVVDQQHEGQATAAGAGIVCPWFTERGESWYTLASAGAKYYQDLLVQLRQDGEEETGYKIVGAMAISDDPEKLDRIEYMARLRQEKAPEAGDITRLTQKQANMLYPPLDSRYEAVHISGAARLDGRLLRNSLQKAAEKHGVQFLNARAELVVEQEVVKGVLVDNQLLAADHVVLTSGAWINEILEPIGVRIPVEPQKGQIAHLELPGVDTSKWPVILPKTGHYQLSFDDSRVVVGATRETGSGFDYRVTAEGLKEVLDEALYVAPGLANSTLKETRIGFRPAGPDVTPLFGRIPTVKGLVVATGLGASGLTMGPYVGKLTADIVLKKDMDVDVEAYSPLRYQKDE